VAIFSDALSTAALTQLSGTIEHADPLYLDRSADFKVFLVLDLFYLHFDICLEWDKYFSLVHRDNDLSLVQCYNNFSNYQLDRLIKRDKLACLCPLPWIFLAWWIVVLFNIFLLDAVITSWQFLLHRTTSTGIFDC
jgi:hypothetical protein